MFRYFLPEFIKYTVITMAMIRTAAMKNRMNRCCTSRLDMDETSRLAESVILEKSFTLPCAD